MYYILSRDWIWRFKRAMTSKKEITMDSAQGMQQVDHYPFYIYFKMHRQHSQMSAHILRFIILSPSWIYLCQPEIFLTKSGKILNNVSTGNLVSPVPEPKWLASREYSRVQGRWKPDIKLIQKIQLQRKCSILWTKVLCHMHSFLCHYGKHILEWKKATPSQEAPFSETT